MTWLLLLLRHDRECDQNHSHIHIRTLVLDLPRVVGREEVAPMEGDDHHKTAEQNCQNRLVVYARPSRRV